MVFLHIEIAKASSEKQLVVLRKYENYKRFEREANFCISDTLKNTKASSEKQFIVLRNHENYKRFEREVDF